MRFTTYINRLLLSSMLSCIGLSERCIPFALAADPVALSKSDIHRVQTSIVPRVSINSPEGRFISVNGEGIIEIYTATTDMGDGLCVRRRAGFRIGCEDGASAESCMSTLADSSIDFSESVGAILGEEKCEDAIVNRGFYTSTKSIGELSVLYARFSQVIALINENPADYRVDSRKSTIGPEDIQNIKSLVVIQDYEEPGVDFAIALLVSSRGDAISIEFSTSGPLEFRVDGAVQ